jgi:hypothetical protein
VRHIKVTHHFPGRMNRRATNRAKQGSLAGIHANQGIEMSEFENEIAVECSVELAV